MYSKLQENSVGNTVIPMTPVLQVPKKKKEMRGYSNVNITTSGNRNSKGEAYSQPKIVINGLDVPH